MVKLSASADVISKSPLIIVLPLTVKSLVSVTAPVTPKVPPIVVLPVTPSVEPTVVAPAARVPTVAVLAASIVKSPAVTITSPAVTVKSPGLTVSDVSAVAPPVVAVQVLTPATEEHKIKNDWEVVLHQIVPISAVSAVNGSLLATIGSCCNPA